MLLLIYYECSLTFTVQPRDSSLEEESSAAVVAFPDYNWTEPDTTTEPSIAPLDPANQQLLDYLCNFLFNVIVQVQNNGKDNPSLPPDDIESEASDSLPENSDSEAVISSNSEYPSSENSSTMASDSESSKSDSVTPSPQKSSESFHESSKNLSGSSASSSSQIASPSNAYLDNSTDPYDNATARPCKYTVPYYFSDDDPNYPDYYADNGASLPSSDSSTAGSSEAISTETKTSENSASSNFSSTPSLSKTTTLSESENASSTPSLPSNDKISM